MNKPVKRKATQRGLSDQDGYVIIFQVPDGYFVPLAHLGNVPGTVRPIFDINVYENCDTKGTFLQQYTDVLATKDPLQKNFASSMKLLTIARPAFVRCKKGLKELFTYIDNKDVVGDGRLNDMNLYMMKLRPDITKLIAKDILTECIPGLIKISHEGRDRYSWMTYEKIPPEEQ